MDNDGVPVTRPNSTLDQKVFNDLAEFEPKPVESAPVEDTETAPVEEETASTDEEEIEASPAGTESEEQVEEPGDSEDENPRTAKARIKELADKNRELEAKLAELSGDDDGLDDPYIPDIKPGDEISPERYKEDVAKTASTLVDLKLKQVNNSNRIKSEIIESLTEHPELDDRSESYDQDLSDTVLLSLKAFIRENPTGDVKGYVNKLMKPYKRAVENAVGKKAEAVVKQASQTALRPTQVKETSKRFEDLSLEEMEARLGKVS